jgi:hypothetical protein
MEQLISEAYDQAIDMIKHRTIKNRLIQCNINSEEDVSPFTFDEMNKRFKTTNLLSQSSNDLTEETESDEDDDSIVDYTNGQRTDENSSDLHNDGSSNDETVLNSMKSTCEGIKIRDRINPSLKHTHFKIKPNDKIKYLHIQFTCWL